VNALETPTDGGLTAHSRAEPVSDAVRQETEPRAPRRRGTANQQKGPSRPWTRPAQAPTRRLAGIPDGACPAVGGFGLSDIPDVLIQAVHARGATGLEVVSNNCGVDGRGLGVLLADGRYEQVGFRADGCRAGAAAEVRSVTAQVGSPLNGG
jgi:hypothetical protein